MIIVHKACNKKRSALSPQSGFTLLEMAVVVVIVGILVASILVGKQMVHNTKLTKVITEFRKYQKAIDLFEEKYNSLPGDMPDAQSYWPSCTNGKPNNECNGNGDRDIHHIKESVRVFEHLFLAGILENSYCGNTTTCPDAYDRYPKSPLKNQSLNYYIYENKNFFFGGGNSIHRNVLELVEQPLRPEDASAIDIKMDDGSPHTGNLMAPIKGTCLDGSGTKYNLNDTTQQCNLNLYR